VAAVALAVIALAIKVRTPQEVEIDPAKLQRAEAEYKRQKAIAESVPALDRANVRASAVAPSPPDEPEPARQPVPTAGEVTTVDSARVADRTTLYVPPGGMDLQLKGSMEEATRLFDRGDYPGAEEAAIAILELHPRNIRMLRIIVSSACAAGNVERAKEYFDQLPARDQEQMRKRCDKWGVSLVAAPAP
jgi:hypothetical protein